MRWVDTSEELRATMERVAAHDSFAVDTEADSLHSYFDKVCLIQLSIPGSDFLIDPLEGIDLSPLGVLLSDPERIKILHGADYDVRILHRDFGFEIRNLIDTMICAQLLGESAVGLAAQLERHFGVSLDKSHQRADWAKRPLPKRMAEYAAMDTRHLQSLAELLRERLIAVGRWEWALEEFRRLEQVRHTPPDPAEERYRRLKGAQRLERRNLEALSRLHEWRDQVARRLDRPPFKILGNEPLVELAARLPRDLQELGGIPGLSGYPLAKFGRRLLETIEAALQVPEEQLPEKTIQSRWARDPTLEARVRRLKRARDAVAEQLAIDPAILAPKHVLTAIAKRRATRVDDLAEIEAMRDWQRLVVGPALIDASSATD